MYRYIASKRQREVILLTALAALISCAWVMWLILRHPNEETITYIGASIGLAGVASLLINALWVFFDDPLLGKFSFDTNGITFYLPFKTLTFPYAFCQEIAFTRWVGASAVYNPQYNYYIYLSKKELSESQREYLLWKRSKKKKKNRDMPLYQREFVVFQYTPKIFADFIKCVPEPFRSKLIEEESKLNLTPREKRLNS